MTFVESYLEDLRMKTDKEDKESWRSKKLSYLVYISKLHTKQYDDEYVEEWINKYVENFKVDKETARECVECGFEMRIEYNKIYKTILLEGQGKINWRDSKKIVENHEKKIYELINKHNKLKAS